MDTGELASSHGSGRIHRPYRTVGLAVTLAVISIWLLAVMAGCSKPPTDGEKRQIPSYGKGSREAIIFTDYFCPPCQALESELEPVLTRLLEKGDVKITFVDAPVHKNTQMYAKYFLYAVHTGADFPGALKARRALFALARSNSTFTDEGLASELRGQGIALEPFDLSKTYAALNELMKNNDIRSTPTCVVKYSDSDVRKYMGPDDIKRGLSSLLSPQNPDR